MKDDCSETTVNHKLSEPLVPNIFRSKTIKILSNFIAKDYIFCDMWVPFYIFNRGYGVGLQRESL